jgi:hypothetical protein
MRYFKQRGHCLRPDSLAAGWGECVRYVEIGEDRYAVRQVEVFSHGRALRYDRSHWCDEFGQLFGCLFSHKQKAIKWLPRAEFIDANEFERAWRGALGSPMWKQQVELSLAAKWGVVPPWLQQAQHAEPVAASDRGGIKAARRSLSPRRRRR